MNRIGFCYHPDVAGAHALASRLARVAESRAETWLAELPRHGDGGEVASRLPGSDVLACVGGDGTVLQAARIASVTDTPVFGVRMGRLGFLAEAIEDEAEPALVRILEGEGRIETRMMLQAHVDDAEPVHALNDVVIGHHQLGRTVSVGLRVDGVLLAEYRADAVIAATATGSTGYALAVGGPILHPSSDDLIVTAVAPHLSYANALVLPPGASLVLEVERGYQAVLMADGRAAGEVSSGTLVTVSRSPLTARFLRLGGEEQFYANLARRLGWLRIDAVLKNDEPPRPRAE